MGILHLLPAVLLFSSAVNSFQVSPLFSASTGSQCRFQNKKLLLYSSPTSDEDYYNGGSVDGEAVSTPPAPEPSPSASWELDPTSDLAKTIVIDQLGLDSDQLEKLQQLALLVTDWNDKINLVSRKDCSPATVFGRHILPSLAVCAVKDSPLQSAKTLVDVGTGGGFPGLPLAIAFPDMEMVLLDSVGKKLTAVQDMVDELKLTNVVTHHGRAEDFSERKFDVATGRSVSAIPQFCTWMQKLLKPDSGRLMYWIGGDVPANVLNKATANELITALVPNMESDKRILTFPQAAVKKIARESGLGVKPTGANAKQRNRPKRQPNSKARAKGSWRKNDPDVKKQRGYEDFKRYSSNTGTAER